MTDTTLTVAYLDPSNKEAQKSISYANPAAANADLVNFTKGCFDLTENTYVGTTRVDKIKLD